MKDKHWITNFKDATKIGNAYWGDSLCVTCGKEMSKCWDTVCAECGDTSCYEHSYQDGRNWMCEKHKHLLGTRDVRDVGIGESAGMREIKECCILSCLALLTFAVAIIGDSLGVRIVHPTIAITGLIVSVAVLVLLAWKVWRKATILKNE